MNKNLIGTGYIASGDGTDFKACMEAYERNEHNLQDLIKPEVLIVTNKNAGAIQKGKDFNLPVEVVDYYDVGGYEPFNARIAKIVEERSLRILFSVGCKKRLKPIESFPGNPFWLGNIHPADPEEDGGDNMYALEPHRHRLDRAADLIWRGRATPTVKHFFYTQIVIHSIEADKGFDQGKVLLREQVLIPIDIIVGYYPIFKEIKGIEKKLRKMNPNIGGMWPIEKLNQLYKRHHELLLEADKVVAKLQEVVLEKEHEILPRALLLVAQKIQRRMY